MIRNRLLQLLAMLAILLALAGPSYLHATEYPIRVTEVKDGDTITCSIVLGFDVVLVNQEVRMLDYDAWESSKRRKSVRVTSAEVSKGKEARASLEKLLSEAKVITAEPQVPLRDNYGRLLLRIRVDGKEVSTIMKELGHDRGNAP